MEKPYRPQTFISFIQLIAALQKIEFSGGFIVKSIQQRELQAIVTSIFYFLAYLTTINSQDLFSTESRRIAIISLITTEKQFPIRALRESVLSKYVPRQAFEILDEYFSFPIVEKPISQRIKPEQRSQARPKSTVFSKSVFSIVSQHDPVSKARYKYIGGEWVAGDISRAVYTPFRVRNYEQEVEKCLDSEGPKDYRWLHLREYDCLKDPIVFNELFYLFLKRDRPEAPRKPIEALIALKNVTARNFPQEIKKENTVTTPSPSKINLSGTNLTGNPPASFRGNSPSSNKTPTSQSQQRIYNRNNHQNSRNSSGRENPSPTSYTAPPFYPPHNLVPIHHPMPPSQPQNYPSTIPTNPRSYQPPPNYPPSGYYAPPNNPAMYGRYPHSGMSGPIGYGTPPPGMFVYKQMPPGPPGVYAPPIYPNNPQALNQYEEQMFSQAFNLVNQLKNSHLSDHDQSNKKQRLNYILSNHPKVHNKLKASLLPST